MSIYDQSTTIHLKETYLASSSKSARSQINLYALSEPTALIENELCNQQDYKRHFSVLAILNVKKLSITQTLNLRSLYRLIQCRQYRGIIEHPKTEEKRDRGREFREIMSFELAGSGLG